MKSDPIKGSLGWPVVPLPDLDAEQALEVEMMAKKPVKYTESDLVKETLNSLKKAEEITGEKFPDRNSPLYKKSLEVGPNYHLADDDDWEDDTGDSVVETRKSIRQAEN